MKNPGLAENYSEVIILMVVKLWLKEPIKGLIEGNLFPKVQLFLPVQCSLSRQFCDSAVALVTFLLISF